MVKTNKVLARMASGMSTLKELHENKPKFFQTFMGNNPPECPIFNFCMQTNVSIHAKSAVFVFEIGLWTKEAFWEVGGKWVFLCSSTNKKNKL